MMTMPTTATPPEGIELEPVRASEEALLRANARLQAVMAMQAELCAGLMTRAEIMRAAVERLRQIIPSDHAAIGLPSGEELELVALDGDPKPEERIRLHMRASVTGWCYVNRTSVRCDEIEADARASVVARKSLNVRSLIAAPLLSNGAALGVVLVMSRAPRAFDNDDRGTLVLLAGVISIALTQAAAAEERQLLLSERTAALDELRASTALFSALTQESDEWVNVLDPDGTMRYAGPAVTRVLGWAPEEVVGRSAMDVVHPEDLPRVRDAQARLVAQPGGAVTMTVRARHKDGRWLHLEGTARNLMHLPEVRGITSNARDVTERVESEKRLRFQAQLLDTVEQGVIAVDRENVITYWNAHAARMFGWAPWEAIGRRIGDMLPVSDEVGSAEGLLALSQGRSWKRECEMQTRAGAPMSVSMHTTPIVEGGTTVGAVAVLADLSERYSLEAQLRESQKMESVGQLAGGVAHDFNNILTSILSYADMLLEDVTDEATRNDLMEIRKAGWRAAELTGKLMAFSRKKKCEVGRLDVGEEIRGLDGMLKRLLREDIDFVVTYPDMPLLVRADRTQIEQLLMNLVVNARDAMPAGGRITVSMERNGPVGDRSESVDLRVRDTGTGMTPEIASRIFEPFFTTKPEGKGTGLGLAVVHGIVRQLNGVITVESAPGEGTEFRMLLPAWSEPLARSA